MLAQNRTIPIITLAAGAVLAACTSGPQIRADADPGANLSEYRTFNFLDDLAIDNSSYTTLLTNRLKASTQRELEARGYKMTASDPQLLVNFNVNVADRTNVESSPAVGGGFYGYRAGAYGMWAGYPQDIHTTHYQQGTLAIDLVDAQKRQLVWQGVAEGRINKGAIENPGPAVDKVVSEIFSKYPVTGSR